MTNESPGYQPSWIRGTSPVDSPLSPMEQWAAGDVDAYLDVTIAGEHLPADAQAILRDNSEAKRLMVGAGLDLDRFAAEIIRARAEWSSIAALDLSESTQGVRSDG